MLEDVNSWEYFRGEELLKIEDWLITVAADKNLSEFHEMANTLLDQLNLLEPSRGEDYAADEWLKIVSTCWGLAEQVEDFIIENALLSDAHEQPEWPVIYDYREDDLVAPSLYGEML